MTRSRFGVAARALGALLLSLISICSHADAATAAPLAGGQAVALVRFVHASPDAAALDLSVDGAVVISGLGYGGATDAFVSVEPGSHEIAASTSGEEGAVVAASWVELAAGGAYAIGTVGMVAEAFVALYPLDLSPPSDGMSRVRLINVAPDAGYVLLATADGSILDAAAFPDGGGYAEVVGGAHELVLLAADESELVGLGSVELTTGATYDILLLGLAGDGSLFVLPLVGTAFADGGSDSSA